MKELRGRITIHQKEPARSSPRSFTIIRGWPGVGKTTLVSALTHDTELRNKFPDGIFWISLGQSPDLLTSLSRWARAIGVADADRGWGINELSHRIARKAQGKSMLFLVDDVWDTDHFHPFLLASNGSAIVVTTRLNRVAQELAPFPSDIYKLDVLDQGAAMRLFRTLAPSVVEAYPQQCAELVEALEGLPLAIQVASRLLEVEAQYGFTAADLLSELMTGKKLLDAASPAQCHRDDQEISATVSALLQKSTDRLTSEDRERYAYLSAFAAKPATFDLEAMASVWQVVDAKPTVRALVDRGLLEPIPPDQRFQMHALLVMHASTLCSE